MELASIQVETTKSLMLPNLEEAIIMPIGDIQLDPILRGRPRSCDITRLKKHIEWGMNHNAYYVGMGDYVDVASPSNRDILKRSGLYDNVQAALEEQAHLVYEELWDILKGTKGRWLGLLEGHHFWEFADGTTTDSRLAADLGCAHLGTTSVVQVRFPATGHNKQPSFKIWLHHGRAGGKLLSVPLNQLEGITKAFEADVYLVGHHHKKVSGKFQKIDTVFDRNGNGRLTSVNKIIACTGSFLKGYQLGSRSGGIPRGGYIETGMMNPVALGGVVLSARPKLVRGDTTVDLDITL